MTSISPLRSYLNSIAHEPSTKSTLHNGQHFFIRTKFPARGLLELDGI